MIIDIIVLVIIALAAFAGYKKGLVGILVSLLGMILAIILGFMLQGMIADMIYNDTSIGKTLEQNIEKNLIESFDNKVEEKTDGNVFYANIVKNIVNKDEISKVSEQITKFILKGVSFIGIFIITFVICYIVQMMLNIVFELPGLSQINEIGGLAIGILKALLKIWIVLAIISFISPLPMFNFLDTFIKDTTITNFLYNHNIFVSLLKIGFKI